ncbi:hypothetical protein ACT9XH_02560 [Methanococcoides methylutens]|uniref:hypothetical protein n=1 Tax=Methanococcoides methylutens TaxID=2226 RepID=UPI0040441567
MENKESPKKGTFPIIPVIILVTGILWLISEMLAIDIPWFPIVLIIVGIGWIMDFYKGK